MLSKCANPGCPAPFLYLHQGRLFRFDIGSDSPAGKSKLRAAQQTARNLEFFWLCDQCATRLTLSYQKGVGVKTVPLLEAPEPRRRSRAMSCS
jgi:hypothetical protein